MPANAAAAAPSAGSPPPAPSATRSPDGRVHVGRDGWLFLVGGEEPLIELYRHRSSFTDAHARAWVELLRRRGDRLEARGIEYVHLGVPDRLTLLHRHHDDANGPPLENPGGSPILQLVARHERETPTLLNIVPYLSRQIDKYPVFWKTDTHWSPWGCYLAYQMLCSRLHIPTNEQLLSYPFEEARTVTDLGAQVLPPREETLRVYRRERHARRTYANPAVRYAEAHQVVGDAALEGASHVIFENRSPTAADRRLVLFDAVSPWRRDELLCGMLAETVRELHVVRGADIDDEYLRLVRPDAVVTAQWEGGMRHLPDDDLDIVRRARERVATHRATLLPTRAKPRSRIRRERLLESDGLPLAPPSTVQPGCVAKSPLATTRSAPVDLVEVHDARVHFSGTRCLVTAPGGEEIHRYAVDEAWASRLADEDHRRLGGTTLLLGDSAGAHCYYHWMLDILPKLGLLERHGVALDSIDRFLVRELTGAFQHETLARFGIGRERILETVRGQHLHCERLLHVRLEHGAGLKMHRSVPAWVRDAFGTGDDGVGGSPQTLSPASRDGDEEPCRRLYVSRPEGVRRGILNEAALRPHLEAAGFAMRVMEGLSVAEQARLFERAEIVMAPHGGALTNMVFCRPGTTVVEILSRHVFPFYYALAATCGHRYHAILEAPEEDYARLVDPEVSQRFAAPEIQWRTQNASFEAPLEAVRETLARL